MEISRWMEFSNKIDSILKGTLDKNIIIFGSSQSGEFIRWFYQRFYGKEIKGIVDRWESDAHYPVLHMMSFYYLYDENDVIINTLPEKLGPEKEFADIGEDWSMTGYSKKQIIDLWDQIYTSNNIKNDKEHAITFYDYLEYTEEVDLLTTVRRNAVKGEFAHGYYPTDFRLIYTIFGNNHLFDKETAILDIGCGKGAGLISLYECGYKKIGGVEYTNEIYNTLIRNVQKLNIAYKKHEVSNLYTGEAISQGINCYLGDASDLDIQLDHYDNYFFFNPFSYHLSKMVFRKIIESLKRKPRKVKLFYAEPICHTFLLKSGCFTLINTEGEDFGGITYIVNVYESSNV